jgi:hypothetical protein
MLLCHSPLGNASSGFLPTIFGVLALSRGPWIRRRHSSMSQASGGAGTVAGTRHQGARARRRSSWGLRGASPPIRIV